VWFKAFLTVLAQTGNITACCAAAKVSRQAAYKARIAHPEFKEAWDDAIEKATDALESEARRRALDGVEKPVFGSGGRGKGTVQVGAIREYSDVLLIFLLKAHRPHKFRDNVKVEHVGNVDAAVRHEHRITIEEFRKLPPAEKVRLLRNETEVAN
jgi:hypothetical protein